jgi:NAD(P)-dependent dehydrogenase (short-subunit alcohol dehydrogenase family)
MFAAEGAWIALIDLQRDGVEAVRDDVEQLGGQGEVCLQDIADREGVNALGERLLQKWGRVDILVNNAAINAPDRNLPSLKPQDWDRVLLVNLTGAYNMVHAVLPAMRRQRDGLIINVSSGAGKLVTSALSGPAYTAAKHGLNGLSHSITKEEAANGIRATALMPGEANTPWAQRRTEAVYTEEERERLVQPEDVAAAMRFVALLPSRVTVPELPVNPTNKAMKPHHRFPE